MSKLIIVFLVCTGTSLLANPKINQIIDDLLREPVRQTSPDVKDKKTEIGETTQDTTEAEGPQARSDHSEAILKTGIQFYNNGLYKQSINKLNELITTFPQSPYLDNARIWIGRSYIRQYKYDNALTELKKIKTDSGEFPTALFYSAQSYKLKGQHDSAIETYNRIQSQFPSHELADNALLQTGKVSLQNKLGFQALEAALKLIKQYPARGTIDEAYYLLGKIFELDTTFKDIEIAITIYKKFLENVNNGKKYFKNSPLISRVQHDLSFLEKHYFE